MPSLILFYPCRQSCLEVKVMEQEEVGEAQGMEVGELILEPDSLKTLSQGQEALEGATIGYTVAVLGCELATV